MVCSSDSVTEEDQRSVGIEEVDKSLQKLFREMMLGVGESSTTLVDPGRPFWGLATQGFCPRWQGP